MAKGFYYEKGCSGYSLIPEVALIKSNIAKTLLTYVSLIPGNQADKAKAIHMTQPRLNLLLTNKLEKFSVEYLLVIAERLGLEVTFAIKKKEKLE